VLIGSRYVAGGGVRNWPRVRRLLSGSVNFLVRCLVRLPAHDTSGGYRCYRVALLRRTNLGGMRSRGYSFQQEVLHRCHRAGARIGETPILFEDRRAGRSKVSIQEITGSIWGLLRIAVEGWCRPGRGRPNPGPAPDRNHMKAA
jgi:dolichol-phosphate mannosyltransferase